MTKLAITHTNSRNRGARNGHGRNDGLTYGDLNTVVGEDQGRVGRSELGVGHCEMILTCGWESVKSARSRVVCGLKSNITKWSLPQKILVEIRLEGFEDLKVEGSKDYPIRGCCEGESRFMIGCSQTSQ